MMQQLINTIQEKGISFSKRLDSSEIDTPFKSKDALRIFEKVKTHLSSFFAFPQTKDILYLFASMQLSTEEKQKFIESLKDHGLKTPAVKIPLVRQNTKQLFYSIVVTEDEDTYMELKRRNIPSEYITRRESIECLKDYDIIRAIDCDNICAALEALPNCFFVERIEECYPERELSLLNAWSSVIILLAENNSLDIIPKAKEDLASLSNIIPLLSNSENSNLDVESLKNKLVEVNSKIMTSVRDMKISGECLLSVLSEKKIPEEINNLIKKELSEAKISSELVTFGIPVELDSSAIELKLEESKSDKNIMLERQIRKNAKDISLIPERLLRIEQAISLLDFMAGMGEFARNLDCKPAEKGQFLSISNSRNLFLENPQPISFYLSKDAYASLLTGANSGGKTTLIEHIIQIISLCCLGIPVSGDVKIPKFESVYYFAKTKGGTNKGAFETLLTQLSSVKCSDKTLVLADELEAVTEPSVAASIIKQTVSYLAENSCQSIFATHIGNSLSEELPKRVRIDGIEAKGIDEENNLIVDHNPVIGRLARSTPEFIIMRLAKKKKNRYLDLLVEELKLSAMAE
jgi:hypothetical protein